MVIVIAIAIDALYYANRIYPNIFIGDVDVSQMTTQKAVAAVEERYATQLSSGTITIYSGPNIKSQKQADEVKTAALAGEQVEARNDITKITINASELESALDVTSAVNEALGYGKGLGSLLSRIGLAGNAYCITPQPTFSSTALESLCEVIDNVVGTTTTNATISIVDRQATYTESLDGYKIDPSSLRQELADAMLNEDTNQRIVVPCSTYKTADITTEMAKETCEKINNAIGDGAIFIFEERAWMISPTTLGLWTKVSTAQDSDGKSYLNIDLNESAVRATILNLIQESGSSTNPGNVTFKNVDGEIIVQTDSTGIIPNFSAASHALKVALYGDESTSASKAAQAIDDYAVEITITTTAAPAELTFQEALDLGVISAFSVFTTYYANGSGFENRITNVHLMADYLDNSIAKKDGETWSFNETGGNTTAERGFKPANVILDGWYVEDYGGGICQVATTIFNAVYEAGLPITCRKNHSIYSSAYPTGRDATVSYNDLDFTWVNNTSSDILIKFEYTDISITCYLYGVDPQLSVTTEVGEWIETEAYTTQYIIDTTKDVTYSAVESSGVTGKSITITRTVKDKNGNFVRQDWFNSSYIPVAETIVLGPSEQAYEYYQQGLVVEIKE